MPRRGFQTVSHLLDAQYGGLFGHMIRKQAPVKTSTTGVFNAIYGAEVFIGFALDANAFGVLPEMPWDHKGYRVAVAPSASTGSGQAQGASIRASTKATFFENDLTQKLMTKTVEMDSTQILSAGKDDVLEWEGHRDLEADTFKLMVNGDLLGDIDTVAGNNPESIDRMCGNTAADVTGAGATAGDEDPWALLDRSDTSGGGDNENSWADAYVSHGGSAGTETDREFSLSFVDDVIANTRNYWKGQSYDNKVFITGSDTLQDWSAEFLPQQKLDVIRARIGINGVQTIQGQDAGVTLNSYQGIPIVVSNSVAQDTKSRVYLLDLDWIKMSLLKSLTYYESDDFQLVGAFKRQGVFHMEGELIPHQFRGLGKIRGLK